MKITETLLQKRLFHYYWGTANKMMPNFNWYNNFECDMIRVTKAGYAYEYEIKLTYSDFLAEKRKTVHKYFHARTGEPVKYLRAYDEEAKDYIKSVKKTYQKLEAYKQGIISAPNYFIYVVHPDILDKVRENLPQMAGLMVYDKDYNRIKEIVKPKKIHKEKVKASLINEIYRIGCNRFLYNHWYTHD